MSTFLSKLKKPLFLLTLILITYPAYGKDKFQQISTLSTQSVVLIENSFYFNSKKITDKKTFRQIEELKEKKILNTWLAVSSGSGFFITANGYVITNNHVVYAKKKDIILQKNESFQFYLRTFFTGIDPEIISPDRLNLAILEFHSLLMDSDIIVRVFVNKNDNFEGNIVFNDATNDIALLQIDNSDYTFLPIPLGSSKTLSIGENIAAIGFPIQFDIKNFFEDMQPTFTIGFVSAIRDDEWGIQHTAAINPGNSGGPLIDQDGLVIGVNVGEFRNANSMYYSVPVDIVKDLLIENDNKHLISNNARDCLKMNRYQGDNSFITSLESGTTLMIKCEKGKKIFLDKKKKGLTPMLLENIKPGKHILYIEDENSYSEITLVVDKKITKIKTYEPFFKPFNGKFYVETSHTDSKIFIDSKYYGESPLVIDELDVGKHILRIKNKMCIPYEKEINIYKNKLLKHKAKLEEGFRIEIVSEVPEYCKYHIFNDTFDATYDVDEEFYLANGNYSISILHSTVEKNSYDFEIKSSDVELTVPLIYMKGKIILLKIKSDSIVLIDNKPVTVNNDNSISYIAGIHDLTVQHDGYLTIKKEIEIQNDKSVSYALTYIKSFKNQKIFKSLAIGLIVPGVILSIYAFPAFIITNLTVENNFVIYQELENFMALLISSSVSIVVVAVLFSIGIPLLVLSNEKARKKKLIKEISLNIQIEKKITVGFSFKL